ncbi:MAG TPA: hypothetical protein VGR32_08355 [Brevundimonas sp.]|jgi:branched-subunit amino acid permease|uniref:hypothetical protein n=1 Tax=Brevundimonas sp. TaxID=1871086 RepID=UPI002DEF33C4|nr:hypothetical protein [Brevundimonas sp.]
MARFRPHPADAATGLVVVAMASAAVLIAAIGPTRSLPVAWGWHGMAEVFASREAAALLLGCAAVVVLLLGAGLGLAARTASDPVDRRRVRLAQTGWVTIASMAAFLWATASLNGVLNLSAPVPLAIVVLALLIMGGMGMRVVRGRRAWHKSEPPRD